MSKTGSDTDPLDDPVVVGSVASSEVFSKLEVRNRGETRSSSTSDNKYSKAEPRLRRRSRNRSRRRSRSSTSIESTDDSDTDDEPKYDTVQHKLFEKKRIGQGQAAGPPPVLFSATVFNIKDCGKRRGRTPIAVYLDDKPLGISRDDGYDSWASDSDDDSRQKSSVPSWDGPVFEVSCLAYAQFQQRRNDPTSLALNPFLLAAPQLLTKLDSVEFTQVSQDNLLIYSPYLYDKLNDFAGYYPSFIMSMNTFTPSSRKSKKVQVFIPDPWAVLFHRFDQIEDYALSPSIIDRTKDLDVTTPKAGQDAVLTKESHDALAESLRKAHVKELYQFLKPIYDSRILPYRNALKEPSFEWSFEMLWYAFKPGTDVYIRVGKSVRVCVVQQIRDNLNVAAVQQPPDERGIWLFDLWYLDGDGQRLDKTLHTHAIARYNGKRNLIDLDICPAATWDIHDGGLRRKSIMKRNTLVAKALQGGHLLAWHEGSSVDGKKYYNGRVVIDQRKGLLQHHRQVPLLSPCDPCVDFIKYNCIMVRNVENDNFIEEEDFNPHPTDYTGRHPAPPMGMGMMPPPPMPAPVFPNSVMPPMPHHLPPPPPPKALRNKPYRQRDNRRHRGGSGYKPPPPPLPSRSVFPPPPVNGEKLGGFKPTELSDHMIFLLCPIIRAFALKTKQWMIVEADNLSEVEPSEEGFANLVLEEGELATIRALATRQNSKRDVWAADFIEGKGMGQIILLHGPPGVGKTYTVESVAEMLHRPLLSLTIADIGTAETRIEKGLLRWFTLAESWNAILLVDEADIFLERRQNRDLRRNGLVSAFLRRMEYFRGLLFLTTNRVGQIDDAFISRVHVALGYKPLSPEARQQIWQGFFRKLAKERGGRIQISSAAKKWVLDKAKSGQAQLNGRDIRNALQTAITLAEAECEGDPDFDHSKMAVIVEEVHFARVLDISNKFHNYLHSIKRKDEGKRAASLEWRNDDWRDDGGEDSDDPAY